MEKISKLSISKLVFYETYPQHIGYSVEEVKAISRQRLTTSYKLYPELAEKFIERDKTVILKRGDNLEDYFFEADDKTIDEIIDLFCRAVYRKEGHMRENTRTAIMRMNLSNLTADEYILYTNLFGKLYSYSRKRDRKFGKLIKSNEKEMRQVTGSRLMSYRDKTVKIESLNQVKNSLTATQRSVKEAENFYRQMRDKMIDRTTSTFSEETDSKLTARKLISISSEESYLGVKKMQKRWTKEIEQDECLAYYVYEKINQYKAK